MATQDGCLSLASTDQSAKNWAEAEAAEAKAATTTTVTVLVTSNMLSSLAAWSKRRLTKKSLTHPAHTDNDKWVVCVHSGADEWALSSFTRNNFSSSLVVLLFFSESIFCVCVSAICVCVSFPLSTRHYFWTCFLSLFKLILPAQRLDNVQVFHVICRYLASVQEMRRWSLLTSLKYKKWFVRSAPVSTIFGTLREVWMVVDNSPEK